MIFAWVPHVFAIELKKTFSYRAAFWVKFFLGTGAELSVAYFVWLAMFRATGATTIQGFTFRGLVFYSLFASFASKICRGKDYGYIAQEIYEGTLNRYLLYPLPFFPYKYVNHIAEQFMGICQLLIVFPLMIFFVGWPEASRISFASICLGVTTCLIAGYLYFVLSSCLELVAFWQDVIWNLMVMLRFCMGLLGGAMVPLVFFPAWGQRIAHLTPFPTLVYFPIRAFLGQLEWGEWLQGMALLAVWSAFFSFLLAWIWKRGTKQYSGVGI